MTQRYRLFGGAKFLMLLPIVVIVVLSTPRIPSGPESSGDVAGIDSGLRCVCRRSRPEKGGCECLRAKDGMIETDHDLLATWLSPNPANRRHGVSVKPGSGDVPPEYTGDLETRLTGQSVASQSQMRFLGYVESFLSDKTVPHLKTTSGFMESGKPIVRALGWVLLYELGELKSSRYMEIVNDADLIVPLTFFDWLRENGSRPDLEVLRSALVRRKINESEILGMVHDGRTLGTCERSLLDMLCAIPSENARLRMVSAFAKSPNISHDACIQALMMLQYEEDDGVYSPALDELIDETRQMESDGQWRQALDRFRDFVDKSQDGGSNGRVYDVRLDEIDYIANETNPHAIRDLADYLENAVFRTGVVVEEGSFDRVIGHLKKRFGDEFDVSGSSAEDYGLRLLLLNLWRIKPDDPTYVTMEYDPDGTWRELDESWPGIECVFEEAGK